MELVINKNSNLIVATRQSAAHKRSNYGKRNTENKRPQKAVNIHTVDKIIGDQDHDCINYERKKSQRNDR